MPGRTSKRKRATNLVDTLAPIDAASMHKDDLYVWLVTRTNDVTASVIVELVKRNLLKKDDPNAF
ncbi:hypothetical protein K3X41_04215 [Aliiroseovarius crassostreae]|uniref:hypothetical protein n=1 Tax=Aliiroseovarius crassostreae TaxID=154981 RepID=UPI00220F6462|nr:hypothetical protein [Aliiroseovarius crassostreae]UWQ11899.1 hypothetical protein K3X41_04215 [Aliiroseovarius crassostreae]